MRSALRLGLPLLLAAAACGDDGVHHLADAPAHGDGAPGSDAPDIDAAPPQPVRLTITVAGAPAMGVPVYFQAPDGTAIATNMTDTTGTASAMMPAGGYVSVVDAFGADDTGTGPGSAGLIASGEQHRVRTFAGAKPGDHLLLTDPGDPDGISVTVDMPDIVDLDTNDYDFLTDCGGNENEIGTDGGEGGEGKHAPHAFHRVSRLVSGGFSLTGCGATANFLVLAITSNNDYQTLGSFVANDVAIADGGTIDFTDKTFTTAVTTSTVFSHVPTAYTDVDLSTDFAIATGVYQSGDYEDTEDSASVDPDGTATVVMARPSLTATRVDHAILSGGEIADQHLYRWGAMTNGDGAFPFDVAGLPLATFATDPALDIANDTAQWTVNADGATPNTVRVAISQERTFPDAPSAVWTWDLVSAYTAPSIVFPKLVGDAAEFNPVAATDINHRVDVIVANVPGGYDVVRARAFELDPESDLSGLAAGTTGHFELEVGRTNIQPPPPPKRARQKAAAIAHPRHHAARAHRH